jgi:hypothetical protein
MNIFNWFRKEKEEKIPILPCVHMFVSIKPLVYKGDFLIFKRWYTYRGNTKAYQEVAKDIKYIFIKRQKCIKCQHITHDDKYYWMYSTTPNYFTNLFDNVICDTTYKQLNDIEDFKDYEEYDFKY